MKDESGMFLMIKVECHQVHGQKGRVLSNIDFDLTKAIITYPAVARDWLLEGVKLESRCSITICEPAMNIDFSVDKV